MRHKQTSGAILHPESAAAEHVIRINTGTIARFPRSFDRPGHHAEEPPDHTWTPSIEVKQSSVRLTMDCAFAGAHRTGRGGSPSPTLV
jgi:hypothetical protein